MNEQEKEKLKFLEEFFRNNFVIKKVKVGNLKLKSQWRLVSKEYYTDSDMTKGSAGIYGYAVGIRDSAKDKTLRRRIAKILIYLERDKKVARKKACTLV